MATTACSNCDQVYPESDIFYCHGCEEYFCSSCGFKNHRDPAKHVVESATEYVATACTALTKDVEKFAKDHTDFQRWVLAVQGFENSLNAIKEIKHEYMKAVKSDSILALEEQLKCRPLTTDQFRAYLKQNEDYKNNLRSTTQEINKVLAALSGQLYLRSGLQKRAQMTVLLTGGSSITDYTKPNSYDTVASLEHTSNTLIKSFPMPALTLKTERCLHQSVLVGESVITMGGYNGQYLSSVECVDLRTRSKCDIASMNNARCTFDAGVIGNRIYVCGGYDNYDDLSLSEYYDIETKKWNIFQKMNAARSAHAGAVLNDVFYTTGGFSNQSTVECYNPITNSWTNCQNLNDARKFHGCIALEGQIYVCGGGKSIQSCECYDPRDGKWKKCGDMSQGRHLFGMAAAGGRLYAIGGSDGIKVLGSVEVYDPRNDTWTIVDDVIEPLCNMSAVAI